MTAVSFALILTGVLLNAAAQLFLKAGTNAIGHFEFHLENLLPIGMKIAFQPWIVAGLSCYVISVVVWILALSRVQVSMAYPMLSIGYVVNAAIAYYWFGEDVSLMRLAGIGIIIIGVVIVSRS